MTLLMKHIEDVKQATSSNDTKTKQHTADGLARFLIS